MRISIKKVLLDEDLMKKYQANHTLKQPTATGQLSEAMDLLRKIRKKIPRNILSKITYSSLKSYTDKYPELRSAVLAVAPETFFKAVYGKKIVILNPNSEKIPLDSNALIYGAAFFASHPKFGRLIKDLDIVDNMRELYGRGADFLLLKSAVRRKVDEFKKWKDGMSKTWAYNVVSFLSDPRVNFGGDSSPVLLLNGGGGHTIRFIKELKGFVSVIVLRPKNAKP